MTESREELKETKECVEALIMVDEIDNTYIGAMCSQFRKYVLKESQAMVAHCCGVSRELISKFERGNSSNAIVFLWYIKMGIFDWVPINKWCGWNGFFE